jgi:hypothetical protein
MTKLKSHSLEKAIEIYHLNSNNNSYIAKLAEHLLTDHPIQFLRDQLLKADSSTTKLPVSQFQKNYWLIRGYSINEAINKIAELQSQKGSFKFKKEKMIASGITEHDAEIEIKKLAEKRSKLNLDSHKRAQEKDPTYLRSMSHQCKEFWIKKGFSEKEATDKAAKVCENNRKKFREKLDSGEIEKGWNNTTIEYYLKKGMTIDEAKLAIIDRQKTFSLEKCIAKYGEKEGREKWKVRQEKWFTNYRKKSYSFVSQELFWEIQKILNFPHANIKFATFDNGIKTETMNLNKEARLYLDNRVVLPDFIHLPSKKIIEFDGVYYHRNTPENTLREKKRDLDLERNGYSVFHVSESDYKLSPSATINRCKQFLNNK